MATSNNKTFSISICRPYTLSTANAFATKNMSILSIDDYCLEDTPRNNSSVEKDRYLYGFGNNNSKTFILKGVQTFHHLTFIHPTVNHGHLMTGHLITLKFNHRETLSRSQVSQEKSRNVKTSKIITWTY